MRIASLSLCFRLTTTGALILLSLAGCAAHSRPAPEMSRSTGAAPSPTPALHLIIGEVAVLDEEKRFVLIDLGSNLYVPDPGTPLRTTREGAVTAQLKASPEQKRPFVAADILGGKPAVGDEVER